jgi:hypothetical protein
MIANAREMAFDVPRRAQIENRGWERGATGEFADDRAAAGEKGMKAGASEFPHAKLAHVTGGAINPHVRHVPLALSASRARRSNATCMFRKSAPHAAAARRCRYPCDVASSP